MKLRPIVSFLSFLFPLLVFVLAPVQAQDPVPGSFADAVDVRVVNVEAVVTDGQGVRVFGLEPQDFQLIVDGEEVPIDYFTEIRGGVALADGAGAAGIVGGIPAVAPGEALGTRYLVFLDELFTLPSDRRFVLLRLLDELPALEPEDRVAVVAWDGHGLDLLSSWTASQRELAQALRGAIERPAYGLHRLSERRLVDRTRFAPFRRAGELTVEERMYVSRLTDQLERTVSAATTTLRSFAQPTGRKVMLLVSGGWPFSPADFVDGTPLGAWLDRYHVAAEELYASLADTANLLGYTLYPVDAPGLQQTAGVSAANAGFVRRTSLTELNTYQERELHHSLDFLARETGGRPLLNGARGRALAAVREDTRSFYWLGFIPDLARDDAQRRIEVEVRRPGLEVRTRSGYVDQSRDQQVAMAVESALLFGHPAGSESLEMDFGVPRAAGRGKIDVSLVVHIPLDAVSLLPVSDHEWVARLQLRIAAVDESGARSEIPLIPVELRRSEGPVAGESVAYETTLRLRRRPHDLVVAVYDEASGSLLSAAAELGS
jgi:VWFA-related protein